MEFEVSPEQAMELDAQGRILKPDWYIWEVDNVEDKTSSKGKAMVLVRVKGVAGDAKAVTVFLNVLPDFAPIFNGFLAAMGGKLNPRDTKTQKFKFDNSTCKGKQFQGFCKPGDYEGTPKNEITSILPIGAAKPVVKAAAGATPAGSTK